VKIAFCTCVQIGKSCIEAIIEAGGRFDLLLSLKDHKSKNKSGRIYLDGIAAESQTPLYKLNHINDQDVVAVLKEYEIDWLFIIGWSQIASLQLINVPKMGVIGAHPTLLPEGRGRAAVPWAIIKGLEKTGVTFFKMDEGVDTGPILGQIEILIRNNETATTLYDRVNKAHVELIKQIWPKLIDGSLVGIAQDESLATYWEGRTPSEGELKNTMSVKEVEILVRATTRPYPGAFKVIDEKTKLIVWNGSLSPHENSIALQFLDGFYYAIDYEYLINE
jgi:methionyl-tRNA formyltransferase